MRAVIEVELDGYSDYPACPAAIVGPAVTAARGVSGPLSAEREGGFRAALFIAVLLPAVTIAGIAATRVAIHMDCLRGQQLRMGVK
jgi:hypothetical protein